MTYNVVFPYIRSNKLYEQVKDGGINYALCEQF